MHRSYVQRATFIAVLASIVFFQCALADVIYAWGANDYGQLGLGNLNPVRSPVVVPFYSSNNIDVADMQLTASYHFATSTDGKVFVSGNNFFGCLGMSEPNPGANISYTPHPTENPQLQGCSVTASRRHANALCDGKAFGWGEWAGNLRVGTTAGIWPKIRESTNNHVGKVEKIHVASRATFVKNSAGTYFSAGNGSLGTLGLGSVQSYGKMQKIEFFDQVPIEKFFSSQSDHVCAVAANHSVFCWGENNLKQLGLGVNDEMVTKPTMVSGIEEGEYYISQIQYGVDHTVALSCGGSVLVWGSRQYGVFGDGVKVNETVNHVQVVEAMEGKAIVEIVSGANTIYARSSDGTWYNWGAGHGGLLAEGSNIDSYTPKAVPSLNILNINHIVMGSSSKSAFGWHVDNKFTTTQNCPTLTNECLDQNLNDCAADGVALCKDTDRRFKCQCPAGYRGNGVATTVAGGNGCTDIDECAENLHSCDSNSVCVNTKGSYECACNAGYHGNGYTAPVQKYVIGNQTAQGCLADVNECADAALNVCSPDAICEDTVWAYNCSCKAGFSGDGLLCSDINECKSFVPPCGSNSICVNTPGNFTCTCRPGFVSATQGGLNCADNDECNSEFACHPNATCTNAVGSYSCKCDVGFQGDGINCLPSTSSSGQPTTGTTANGTDSTGPTTGQSTGGGSANSTGSSTDGESTSGGVSGTGAASTYNMTIGAQNIGWAYAEHLTTSGSSGTPDLSAVGAETGASDDEKNKKIILGVFVGFVGLVIIAIAVVVGIVISRRRRSQNAWA